MIPKEIKQDNTKAIAELEERLYLVNQKLRAKNREKAKLEHSIRELTRLKRKYNKELYMLR